MKLEFRKLLANEIECRIGTVKEGKGMSLLLYKNSRTDMDLLDETVGSLNWQRDHKELKGVIYCGVSILDERSGNWVTKWDAGSESYTEKEKGEASDSFKRACVNIGIGRELYTAPFIWITGYNKFEKFKVAEITYLGNDINHLVIVDSKGKVAFSTRGKSYKPKTVSPKPVVQENVQETVPTVDLDDLFSGVKEVTTTPCTKCGGGTTFKEGVSKAGKPYKMNKCNDCGNVDWVK